MVATSVVMAIMPGAAGAGGAETAAVVQPIGQLAIRLPSPGESRMVLLTLKLAVRRGDIPRVRLRGLNEAKLPSGIRAVGAVVAPRLRSRSETVDVYVGINNLSSRSADRSHLSSGPPDLEITSYLELGSDGRPYISSSKLSDLTIAHDCISIVALGALADRPGGVDVFRRVVLTKLADEPGSAAEAILDHVAYKECKAMGAELPEPGDGPE